MPPDTAALLTLAGLAGFALAYLARQFTDAGGWAIWVLSWFFRCFCVLRLSQRMQGPCPLPIHGGALVVGNHRSPTDPMVIHSATLMKADGYRIRVVEYLTASEYCTVGGIPGWIMRVTGCIPVDRDGLDMEGAKMALRRLHAGKIVGIFPEGGIHIGPGLGEFNPGVAWLALRGKVPVYPVIVRNTPYQDPVMSSVLLRQPADAVFGPEIDLSRLEGGTTDASGDAGSDRLPPQHPAGDEGEPAHAADPAPNRSPDLPPGERNLLSGQWNRVYHGAAAQHG